MSVQVSPSNTVKLDSSGNGQCSITPPSGTRWELRLATLSVSTSANQPQGFLYRGSASGPIELIDSTYTGAQASSGKVAGAAYYSGQMLWAVWKGGDAGAIATVQAYGTQGNPADPFDPAPIGQGFDNPIVAGTKLIIPAINSPNYVAGSSGWTINQDGTAEFNNVTVRGNVTSSTLTSLSSSTNLVSNPSFETNPIVTSGDVGTWSFTTAQAHTGVQSLTVVGDSTVSKSHQIYPITAFTAPSVVGSLWLKVADLGVSSGALSASYAGMKIHFYNSSNVEIGTPLLIASGQLWSFACVDALTEIFTRRGWLTYDQVQPTDETLTINTDTGSTEWAGVERIVRTPVQLDMVRLESSEFSALSTKDHRWLVFCDEVWLYRKTEDLVAGDLIPVEGVSDGLVDVGSLKVTTEPYDGVIWCPTTRNGNWLARRDGSVYYTGNKP